MIFNNLYPGQKVIYTCSECGKTFERGNTLCLVMHYGRGCCHYGDKEVEVKFKKVRKRGKPG